MEKIFIYVTRPDGTNERIHIGTIPDTEAIFDPAKQPKIGLVVGTFGSVPYVHLGLESWRRHYSAVPLLVHDDCSSSKEALASLCGRYGATFETNSGRRQPGGDLSVFAGGFRWAQSLELDVLVKFSRRFIPLHNWFPGLCKLACETQYATFSNVCVDHRLGFRTECIAMHVHSWLLTGAVDKMRRDAMESRPNFVEGLIHGMSIEVAQRACRRNLEYVATHPKQHDHRGYGDWPLLGTSKAKPRPEVLWWNANPPRDYWQLSRAWELPYSLSDFENVEK